MKLINGTMNQLDETKKYKRNHSKFYIIKYLNEIYLSVHMTLIPIILN